MIFNNPLILIDSSCYYRSLVLNAEYGYPIVGIFCPEWLCPIHTANKRKTGFLDFRGYSSKEEFIIPFQNFDISVNEISKEDFLSIIVFHEDLYIKMKNDLEFRAD